MQPEKDATVPHNSHYEQLGTVLMLLFGLGMGLVALAMVMFL
jgi:hypothetical protein